MTLTCPFVCLAFLLQHERDDDEENDENDGASEISDDESKSAEHNRVRPSAPPSKPADAPLTGRRIPEWCRGELKACNGKTTILQVKSSTSSRVNDFVVQVDRENSYETAMEVIVLHDECKKWIASIHVECSNSISAGDKS